MKQGDKTRHGQRASCDAILEQIRQRHQCPLRAALPAKSTVGLVLDGTTVTLVVPGSPSSKIREDGRKIEPGDVVTHIDGLPVEKHNVIAKLRGSDFPSSDVSLTVTKHDTMEVVNFKMVRADMRSVMALKDLYLSLGEIHTELDHPHADTNAKLRKKLEVVEQRLEEFATFAEKQQTILQAHVCDLEDTVKEVLDAYSPRQKEKFPCVQEPFEEESQKRPISEQDPLRTLDLSHHASQPEHAHGLPKDNVPGCSSTSFKAGSGAGGGEGLSKSALLKLIDSHERTLDRANSLAYPPRRYTPRLHEQTLELANALVSTSRRYTPSRLSEDLAAKPSGDGACAYTHDVTLKPRLSRDLPLTPRAHLPAGSGVLERRMLSNGAEIWVKENR